MNGSYLLVTWAGGRIEVNAHRARPCDVQSVARLVVTAMRQLEAADGDDV